MDDQKKTIDEGRADGLAHDDPQTIEKIAEESRDALDKVTEHGTDPLNEGP